MKPFTHNLMKSVALFAGIAAIPFVAMAGDTQDPVLVEARANAARISADWKSFTQQPKLSWTSDSAEAARLKEDVIAAAATRSKLDGFRSQAPASQLAALDQIIAVMEEMSGYATSAVDFLSTNRTRLSDKDYKAYLAASSDVSNRLAGLVSQLVEYKATGTSLKARNACFLPLNKSSRKQGRASRGRIRSAELRQPGRER